MPREVEVPLISGIDILLIIITGGFWLIPMFIGALLTTYTVVVPDEEDETKEGEK